MRMLRIFDQLQAAQAARRALVEAGFPAQSLELTATGDEAGAVQGNFLVGNPKTGAAADGNYESNFADVAFGSLYLLSVEIAGEADRRRALALMDRFGGRDMDAAGVGPGPAR